mmetsp:Transcript_3847/g.13702  ORF Transcript_3847/g.13702 Transcript_3847/m.13702 type:complete len:354 (+) Transcript_3847:68-1129(+)
MRRVYWRVSWCIPGSSLSASYVIQSVLLPLAAAGEGVLLREQSSSSPKKSPVSASWGGVLAYVLDAYRNSSTPLAPVSLATRSRCRSQLDLARVWDGSRPSNWASAGPPPQRSNARAMSFLPLRWNSVRVGITFGSRPWVHWNPSISSLTVSKRSQCPRGLRPEYAKVAPTASATLMAPPWCAMAFSRSVLLALLSSARGGSAQSSPNVLFSSIASTSRFSFISASPGRSRAASFVVASPWMRSLNASSISGTSSYTTFSSSGSSFHACWPLRGEALGRAMRASMANFSTMGQLRSSIVSQGWMSHFPCTCLGSSSSPSGSMSWIRNCISTSSFITTSNRRWASNGTATRWVR